MTSSPAGPAATPDPRPTGRRRSTHGRRVTHVDLLLTLGAFLLTSGMTGALLLVLARTGVDLDAALVLTLSTGVVLWLVGVALALRRRGWSWDDLGLGRPPGALGPLTWQVPLAWLVVMMLTALVGSQLMEPGESNVVAPAGAALALGPVAVAGLLAAVVVVGPLVEEIIFRRVLLGWLETRVGTVLAIVLQAALFAVLHVVPQAMVLTFFLGLATAILARLHRSLWPAVVLHGAHNAVATVLVLTLLG